jgi:hypothetical protein
VVRVTAFIFPHFLLGADRVTFVIIELHSRPFREKRTDGQRGQWYPEVNWTRKKRKYRYQRTFERSYIHDPRAQMSDAGPGARSNIDSGVRYRFGVLSMSLGGLVGGKDWSKSIIIMRIFGCRKSDKFTKSGISTT